MSDMNEEDKLFEIRGFCEICDKEDAVKHYLGQPPYHRDKLKPLYQNILNYYRQFKPCYIVGLSGPDWKKKFIELLGIPELKPKPVNKSPDSEKRVFKGVSTRYGYIDVTSKSVQLSETFSSKTYPAVSLDYLSGKKLSSDLNTAFHEWMKRHQIICKAVDGICTVEESNEIMKVCFKLELEKRFLKKTDKDKLESIKAYKPPFIHSQRSGSRYHLYVDEEYYGGLVDYLFLINNTLEDEIEFFHKQPNPYRKKISNYKLIDPIAVSEEKAARFFVRDIKEEDDWKSKDEEKRSVSLINLMPKELVDDLKWLEEMGRKFTEELLKLKRIKA
jgi:hypothetical protein